MKMKARIVWTICLGVGWTAFRFLPVWSPERMIIWTLPPLVLVFLLCFFGLPVFTVYSFVGVFTQWKRCKARAFIPVLLCVGFFFLASAASHVGLQMRISSFRRHLPEFDEKAQSMVQRLRDKGAQGSNLERVWAEDKFSPRHVSRPYKVYAELETNGVAAVRFSHVVTLNFHHVGYMYRSDGDFDSALWDRERIQERINKHWCAVAD
ncbi:MAG: hypothetical protein JXR37_21295 [Kiritimatiellae bacterium]|nr:hypothetical protein [Kiritimatiellia bacterium]